MNRRVVFRCALALLSLCSTGCHAPTSSTIAAAPTVPVAAGDQAQAAGIAQAYAASLRARDYPGASRSMSPKFHAQAPRARWQTWLRGPYQPLATAANLSFDSAQPTSHGRGLILYAHFSDGGGRQYRTNFLMVRGGKSWLVDGVVPPATHRAPTTMREQAATH